ncbi:N-methyl-L-tryptophan oxidase [Marinactinospora thermotolerans]|uniref:Sarcosine oxidase n=1 Tax=Marinactinospora thermotolerans DSM 45154 TaxID=1122192 RepID=A0A1T4SGP0_9ACTN|nr:N-methyl-L-tryptophan oxidase [Marinactinospora thermotolerans]SKA27355.1 sarcosine oxidase [Marinactinospora thermotolerans DSM 45154]
MSQTADVVVVGLGAMGAQTLWRLARRGVDVLGVERFEPGHAHGSSHGESRIIRTAYLEGADYVPLALGAWEAWAELSAETGAELVTRCGGLVLGRAHDPSVAGTLASARARGLRHERLDAAELSRRFPRHLLEADQVGVFEEAAGVVRPEAAIRAAVDAARAAGARVRTGCAVTRIVPDPDRPRVVVGDTEIRARHVVVTAGAWTSRLLPDLAAPLHVERRVLAWFPVDDPAAFTPDRFPVFIRDEPDGTTWYGFPSLDGATVKIAVHADAAAGPGAQRGEPADPDEGPRRPDAADAARMRLLAERIRGLGGDPVRMSACMYTMTPDEHFVIGSRPHLPGLTVAAGFSGHGYKFASIIGVALADLAETGRTSLPIGLFDPARPAVAGSLGAAG